jgi:Molybdopterin-binding domain of aldehyde dehydrogenase
MTCVWKSLEGGSEMNTQAQIDRRRDGLANSGASAGDKVTYVTSQDVGLCVSPDQVEGQRQGGATQGIGWALSEGYAFDDTGAVHRTPACWITGIRAVGQVPIVPPAAALANAICWATTVGVWELPMIPERLYWAMQDDAGRSLT